MGCPPGFLLRHLSYKFVLNEFFLLIQPSVTELRNRRITFSSCLWWHRDWNRQDRCGLAEFSQETDSSWQGLVLRAKRSAILRQGKRTSLTENELLWTDRQWIASEGQKSRLHLWWSEHQKATVVNSALQKWGYIFQGWALSNLRFWNVLAEPLQVERAASPHSWCSRCSQ